ncbi:MAG: hypothetical protein JO103_00895 [Candidatus Eremiobacteraeota bacterium]|nr:hypothetical protein [Candidatus Eremiobacteraeota bacterium]MBV9409820.1 hypothetical protein [Candidatus Eremiobacteraeota bacterium]
MLALVMLAAVVATPTPDAFPTPTPQRTLGLIRAQFRSHRPPPPFETYTLVRTQKATNGYPDFANSYTRHYWVRNLDRAALRRDVFRDDARGPLTFDRPAFNEARDPGPPTADVFEPAPTRPHPVDEVPTPEPNYTPLPVIGGVRTIIESDYKVESMEVEGDQLHLHIFPIRDIERNRLREIYCDKKTYELRKLIATDKLFVDRGNVYPVTFTITMGMVRGVPVVTDIHGIVGGGYNDDGKDVDFEFRDITFPDTLPEWYFNARTYAQHANDSGPL